MEFEKLAEEILHKNKNERKECYLGDLNMDLLKIKQSPAIQNILNQFIFSFFYPQRTKPTSCERAYKWRKQAHWLVESFLLKLWLDQGLTRCHVKWTLATPHRTKKQRFQCIFYRQHCTRTTQKSVSNGKLENLIISLPAAARPRKVKYNYETQNQKNLEQLNTLNHGIIIINLNVGCSTIIAYCALNAHFPALLILATKRSPTSCSCSRLQ